MKWRFVLVGAAFTFGAMFLWMRNDPYLVHAYIEAPITESRAMRWYRCLGVDRPLLAQPGAPWTFNYSWSDGFGPGSVAVEIGSDGHARLRAWPADGTPVQRSAVLPPDQVRHIAALVDETGLLCQTPAAHPAFTVEDRGTYVVSVRSGARTGTVFVDACHEIPDGAAFGGVLDRIRALRNLLGEEIEWGPGGSIAIDSPCTPATPRVLVPGASPQQGGA